MPRPNTKAMGPIFARAQREGIVAKVYCPVLDSARIGTLGFPDKGDSSWPAFRSLRPA
jgi:hypothetical protein